MQRRLNVRYGLIHGTYWMSFGALYSFSSIFLLSKGYSNSTIGLILAFANILAVVMQPFLADFADRRGRNAIFYLMEGLSLLVAIAAGSLIFLKEQGIPLTLVFMVTIGLIITLQPFANSMNRRLEGTGVRIAFGICRSVGSLAYAVLCFILGWMTKKFGAGVLPFAEEVCIFLFMLVILSTFKVYQEAMKEMRPEEGMDTDDSREVEEIGLVKFLRENKTFVIMSLGVLGVFFSNSTVNMYMAQITANVGGDSQDTGRVFSILAFMEIPTLVFFDKLYQKFKCSHMLKFSAVAFVFWVGGSTIARSVGMLFGIQLFQMLGFALFLPAMVRFIEENMREGEAVKGQTLFVMMTTGAAVFAGLLGGRIIDYSGVTMLTGVATAVTVIGALIIFLTVDKVSMEGRLKKIESR